jgi:hypothetical protein
VACAASARRNAPPHSVRRLASACACCHRHSSPFRTQYAAGCAVRRNAGSDQAGRRTRLTAPRRHGSLGGRCRSRRTLAVACGRAARRAVASAASAGRASRSNPAARRRQSCRLARALSRAAAPASARHAARAPTNGALARPRDAQETRTRPDWLFALTWLIRARAASRARTRAAAAVAAPMRAPVRPARAASRRLDAPSQAALLLRPAPQRRLRRRTRGSSRCARRSATWHTPVRALRCVGFAGVSQASSCAKPSAG